MKNRKKGIKSMVLLCCLMFCMMPCYNVYGAAFEDDLEEVREELGDSGESNCTSDGFKYEIVTNPSTNKEEVVIVGYDAPSAGGSETLVIPEKIEEKTVTALKNLGYINNSPIKKIEIPAGISSIDVDTLRGCYSLSIEVKEGNPKYCSENGMLFNKDKTELYFCPGGEGKVIIPSSVTHIGSAAYSIIARLDEVEVASGNQNYSAENGLIFNKDKTELYLCLTGKKGVVEIPPGVTKITENVFQDHDFITEVKIPAGVVVLLPIFLDLYLPWLPVTELTNIMTLS